MTKKIKEPLSDKVKLKKNKTLLPKNDLESPEEVQDVPKNDLESPKNDLGKEEEFDLVGIIPKGIGQKAVCGLYDLLFRGNGPALRPDERELFKESADQLEVEVIKVLPEKIQALADKYGGLFSAGAGLALAFLTIQSVRAQEQTKKKPEVKQDPAAAVDKIPPATLEVPAQ
ncbi:MAG: hypothetical protein WC394_02885 [Candidatus Omnitrophota bacterium]|jgi:hypothetical protein